ncbi:unnamed protein product, partial [Didymodactylos carnosus]
MHYVLAISQPQYVLVVLLTSDLHIISHPSTGAFLQPIDVKTIIKIVFDLVQLDFETSIYASMPLIEVVTQLLCFQQLVFIPSSLYQATSPDEIGRLVGTNLSGLPRINHVFSV